MSFILIISRLVLIDCFSSCCLVDYCFCVMAILIGCQEFLAVILLDVFFLTILDICSGTQLFGTSLSFFGSLLLSFLRIRRIFSLRIIFPHTLFAGWQKGITL